ncbi:MAG: hypothetical protein GY723_21655, partial [bacterium]|nr:hypothetical protein [bacterium]
QLRQRIVLRHRLRPFTKQECADYIEERLRLAGYTGKGIFDKAALREIHRVTGGTPRLINIVCDGALLAGFGRDLQKLGAGAIREVAKDLELTPGPEGPAANDEPTQAPDKRSGLFGWLRTRQTGGL